MQNVRREKEKELDPRKYASVLAARTSTAPTTPPIQFTRFSSRNHDLTKRIARDAAGKLRATSGSMAIDDFALRESSFAELPAVIAALTPRQVLAWGVPKSGDRAGEIATVARIRNGRARGNTIARSGEYFHYPAGPALLMLDVDLKDVPDAQRPNSIDEIRTRLVSVVSALGSAPMLALPSAGAMIYDTATDEQLRGLTGVRFYVLVATGSDIPAIGALLRDRLVHAGFGFDFVSRAGTVQVRTLIDSSVWQPERLDFIGGALCGDGLEQRRGEPRLWNSAGAPLKLDDVVPLTEAERNRLTQIERAIVEAALPRAAETRAAYIAERRKMGRTVSAQWTPDAQIEWLNGDHTIDLTDGSLVTVDDILANPAKYDDATCADPLEPEYADGDRRIARIYALGQDSGPAIHSFAHGGRSFLLRASAAADFADIAAPAAAHERTPCVALPTEGERIAALHGTADRALLLELATIPDGALGARIDQLQAAAETIDPLQGAFPTVLKEAHGLRGYASDEHVFDTMLRARLGGHQSSNDARLLRRAAWALVTPTEALGDRLAVSPGELSAPSVIERDWLVDGYATPGWVGALVGESSGGKTFLATHLAALVSGEVNATFGGHAVRQGSVLYCPSEDRDGVRERFQRYGPCTHVYVAERTIPLRSATDAVAFIRAAIAQIPHRDEHPLRLVVIDTLSGALGAANENDVQVMAPAIRVAKLVARMTGAFVLLLHHTGHGNQDRARGSSAFNAELDVGFLVKKADDNITLTNHRLKTGPQGEVLRFHINEGIVRAGVAAGISEDGEPDAYHVVRAMREISLNGAGVTKSDVGAALAESCPSRFGAAVARTTVRDRLNRALGDAHKRGWIEVRRARGSDRLLLAVDPPEVLALPVGDLTVVEVA